MDNGRLVARGPELGSRATRPPPPAEIFVSLVEQLANVRRWNEEREWGFSADHLDSIDLTPANHTDPLIVDLIAVYMDADETMNGVRRTCHELWKVAADRQPNAWSWDWYWDRWQNHPKPVRLLDGLVHRPGVRRVTLDLGAHWQPGRYIRPVNIRGRRSAHAEILAAAAHFPRWARAMDGRSVPYIWLSGYQVTIPEYASQNRLPGLAWTHFRRTLSLTINWAEYAHTGWAAPMRID
ncbi:MAG: hypothetical protein M3308_11365 [Actinomycetota bacterium]|nr:hypothetical protein [Actinomycetota bacterium]